MDQDIVIELLRRTEQLERRLRFFQAIVALAVVGVVAYACTALPAAQAQPGSSPGILRVRGIIIQDAQGRDRVVLGAPVPDPAEGARRTASTGMIINDTAGMERFGVGLFEDGTMSMGFDAPPGTGDERNRERLTMGADGEGNGYIHVFDRRTGVPFRIYSDAENHAWVEFLHFEFNGGTPTQVVRRRLGFGGWDTIIQPMQP